MPCSQENDAELKELEQAVGPWPWRTDWIAAASPKPISRKTTLLLALVTFAGYELFLARMPDPKLIGTYNQIDRSKQYTRADSGELLRSLNEAWAKIRQVEAASLRKDVEIGRLHVRVGRWRFTAIALTSIITSLAWEGLKLLTPLVAHYLGMG